MKSVHPLEAARLVRSVVTTSPTLVMSASPTPGGVAKIRDENVRGDVRVQVRPKTSGTNRFVAWMVGWMVGWSFEMRIRV